MTVGDDVVDPILAPPSFTEVVVRLDEPMAVPADVDDGSYHPVWHTEETEVRVEIQDPYVDGVGRKFKAQVAIPDDERRRIEIPPRVADHNGEVLAFIEAERDNNGMTEEEAQDAMMNEERYRFGEWSEPEMWMDVPDEDGGGNAQQKLGTVVEVVEDGE